METLNSTESQCLKTIAYPEKIRESKSSVNPQVLLWALIAVVLFVIYLQQPDKESTLCIIQLSLIVACALLAVIKLFIRDQRLTYIPTGSLVVSEERYYNLSLEGDIRQCLREGDISRLRAFKTDDTGGIMVETLVSKDKLFTAMRMQKYYPEGYIPVTEWREMDSRSK